MRSSNTISLVGVLLCCISLYAACGQEQPQSLVITQTAPQPKTALVAEDQPPTMTMPTPAVVDQPHTTMTVSPPAGDFYRTGPESVEEIIIWSDIVAKVRMRSATGTVEYGPSAPDGYSTVYTSALDFNFEVLEYLKGAGSTEIVAVVRDHIGYDTEAEAYAVLPGIVASRDTRWDDREAIVFLDDVYQREGRYLLGYITLFGEDAYTVASPYYRTWLPDAKSATSSATTTGSSVRPGSSEQQFLLADPAKQNSAGGSGQSSVRSTGAAGDSTTITLSALNTRVAELRREVDAGDGSREYMKCVHETYLMERQIRWLIRNEGTAVRRIYHNVGSGLRAGTAVYQDNGIGLFPDKAGRHWLEGEDNDLFTVGTFDYLPFTFAGNGPHDSIWYTRRISTVRPLPAGEYRFFSNGMWAGRLVCGAYSELERNLDDNFVTATAPENTVHEAFFDPAAIGSGVGASATDGVLKPAAFSLDNSTTTISSLKWHDGSVVMTLTPYTSLSAHTLSFIELDGEVSLSLNTDAATSTAASSTLSWSVTDQLWHDGDLLMLRIVEAP